MIKAWLARALHQEDGLGQQFLGCFHPLYVLILLRSVTDSTQGNHGTFTCCLNQMFRQNLGRGLDTLHPPTGMFYNSKIPQISNYLNGLESMLKDPQTESWGCLDCYVNLCCCCLGLFSQLKKLFLVFMKSSQIARFLQPCSLPVLCCFLSS